MITSTSLTHPTTIAKIRAAVASAVQAKDCIAFVANKVGETFSRYVGILASIVYNSCQPKGM